MFDEEIGGRGDRRVGGGAERMELAVPLVKSCETAVRSPAKKSIKAWTLLIRVWSVRGG